MTKRTKKILVAVVLIAAFAVYAYVKVFRVHGFIVALEPVDRDRAIVCVRANDEYGQPARSWVGLLDAKRGWVWSKKLTGLPIIGASHGLLVDGGLAIVRTTVDPGIEGKSGLTTAYAVENGEKKWETHFDRSDGALMIDLVADGPRVLQGIERGRDTSVVALDRMTGRVEWTLALPDLTQDARALGGSVFLRGLFPRASGVDPVAGGPPGAFLTDGALCFEKDEHVFLEQTREGTRIVARKTTGERRIVVAKVEIPIRIARAQRCGRYGDHLVFAIPDWGDDPDVALLEIDPASGTQVSFARLGLGSPDVARIGQSASRFPEHAALNGTIPRFVPLLARAKEAEGEQLVVLDMQERRIVRRGPSPGHYLHIDVIAVGDVFYLHETEVGTSTLARFDGKTGRMTAAVTQPGLEGLKPMHVRDGRVWVYRGSWFDELPYAVLDAETLAPVAANGPIKIEDVLASTKQAWLGNDQPQ